MLAPLKGGKTREVPLPEVVATTLAAHVAMFPPLVLELPWLEPGGPVRSTELIFGSRESAPVPAAAP